MKQTEMFPPSVPFALERLWSMEPRAFEQLREAVATCSPERLAAAGSASAAAGSHPGYENRGGVALIRFEGVVSKRETFWSRIFGGRAVTTTTRDAIAAALADPTVSKILLVVDSPGGTVDGTADLADTVFTANQKKPVTAYAEDTMASAAYWIGSQAGRLVANKTAAVGSIGVFSVVPDFSRIAKNIGIEVNVVRSAPGKGAGAMGTAVTDAQLEDIQREVDALHVEFVGAVARGRRMSAEKAAALGDGRVSIGKAAVSAGLVDELASLDDTVAAMQRGDDENVEPVPDDERNEPQGVLGTVVAHTHELDGSNPSPATTTSTTPAEPAIEPRAEVEGHLTAQEEEPMADTTKPAVTAEQLEALTSRFDTLAKENADLKAKLESVSGNVVAITTERQISALLETARREVKLTKGNEAVLEPAIRAMAAIDLTKATAFVEGLPKQGKGEGSVLTPASGAAAPAARNASDHVGGHLAAYQADAAPIHQLAIAFKDKAEAAGKTVSYRDAVIAVTRKNAA